MQPEPTTASYLGAAARCLGSRSGLAAVAILLVNDHVLKLLAPSWLTGKLSDIAGLYAAPYLALLLVFGLVWAVQETIRRGGGDTDTLTPTVADALTTSVYVALGVVFAALKLAPATAGPIPALLELVTGVGHTAVVDPSDLLALAALPLSYACWRRQTRHEPGEPSTSRADPRVGIPRVSLAQVGRALAIVLTGLATVATSMPSTSQTVVGLAVDPRGPGAAYALVRQERVSSGQPAIHEFVSYWTTDGGGTWLYDARWTDASGPARLIPDPAQPGGLYLVLSDSIWRIEGSAATRRPVRVWLPSDRAAAVAGATTVLPAVVPLWDGALYVAVGGALLRSGDGGANWTTLRLPGPADQPVAALAAGRDAGLLVVAQGRELWRSRDAGSTWEPLASLEVPPRGLWAHPGRSATLLAATPYTLRTSDDGGLTWRPTAALDGRRVTPAPMSVAFDPANDATVLVAVPGTGVLRSDDAGGRWERILAIDALGVVVLPRLTHRTLVAGGRDGVYRQRDWLRWPWQDPWERVNDGLIGRLTTRFGERSIDVLSSVAAWSVITVALLLAARRLVPTRLRYTVLAHPWEVALAVWTLVPTWLLLRAPAEGVWVYGQETLLAGWRFNDVRLAAVPALGALLILARARWSWPVWGLSALPLVLTLAAVAGLLSHPRESLAARLTSVGIVLLTVLLATALLALPARYCSPRVAKAVLLAVGALIYLALVAIGVMLQPLG